MLITGTHYNVSPMKANKKQTYKFYSRLAPTLRLCSVLTWGACSVTPESSSGKLVLALGMLEPGLVLATTPLSLSQLQNPIKQ